MLALAISFFGLIVVLVMALEKSEYIICLRIELQYPT